MNEINVVVSIIMPVYNAKKYLKKSIESVINQSYKNWELIIINDKSTDGSKLIIEEFIKKDSRIKIINNDKNSGCYVSLNKGIQCSIGKYIARLDADDYMDKHKLEKQIKYLDLHPNKMLVFCNCYSSKILTQCLGTAMMRREIFDKIGYYDSVRIAADTEFKHRIYIIIGKNLCGNIPEILYHITPVPYSLSRNLRTGMATTPRIIYHNNYKLWHNQNKNNHKKLIIHFPLINRPFTVPKSILP